MALHTHVAGHGASGSAALLVCSEYAPELPTFPQLQRIECKFIDEALIMLHCCCTAIAMAMFELQCSHPLGTGGGGGLFLCTGTTGAARLPNFVLMTHGRTAAHACTSCVLHRACAA